MGKINTNNYPNRPVSDYQDDDMFVLQDNGGETYTTNVGDIKNLVDNRISGKADKVSSATAGHLAGLDANGNLTDSGISASNDGTISAVELVLSDGVTANDISYFNEIDLDGSSIYGVGTLNVNQIDVHDGQAVEFLTDVLVNGNVADEDGNVLSNKTDKVENATSGHLAGLDSNGNLTDSGVSPTEDVTVEGNPVTFDSPFEQDAKNVVVSVKPIQDLHGYDHPWVGGAGKNKLPLTVEAIKAINTSGTWTGNTYTKDGMSYTILVDDGDNVVGIRVNGETSVNTSLNLPLFSLPTGTYIVSVGALRSRLNKNGSQIADISANQSYTLAVDSNSDEYILYLYPGATSISNVTVYPMIRLATETDASFAPYSNICPISGTDEVEIEVSDGESEPTTTTIPLPSTLYDADVDVTNGDADENNGFKVLSSADNWKISTNPYVPSGRYVYYIYNLFANSKPSINDNNNGNVHMKSNIFDIGTYAYNLMIQDTTFSIGIGGGNDGSTIGINTDIDNLQDFKDWVDSVGIQIMYELATPTTISFDPTDVELLEGTNVVSTNGEKVAVTYGRSLWQDIDDLKTDTEGKLNKSDVADIEGDTASRPYSVNEFMLRSDGFYKVTQPIAQNASITSSNTTKTTVGEVLTALLNA